MSDGTEKEREREPESESEAYTSGIELLDGLLVGDLKLVVLAVRVRERLRGLVQLVLQGGLLLAQGRELLSIELRGRAQRVVSVLHHFGVLLDDSAYHESQA